MTYAPRANYHQWILRFWACQIENYGLCALIFYSSSIGAENLGCIAKNGAPGYPHEHEQKLKTGSQ